MKYWKELPYRGDGESRNSKPLRRFVNLKKARREILISIFMVIMLSAIMFGCILFDPNTNIAAKTAVIVIGSIFTLTLVTGILSFNKFRKGHDADISEKTEKDKDEQ